MKKVYSRVELFKLIEKDPSRYLYRGVGITNLINFNGGYLAGVASDQRREYLKNDEYYKFQDYIRKVIPMRGKDFMGCLLVTSDGDERKAFDLFYELLDDFIDQMGIIINLD